MKKLFGIILTILLLVGLTIRPVVAAYEDITDFKMPSTGIFFKFDGNAEDSFGNVNVVLGDGVTFVEGRDGTPNGAALFDNNDAHIELLLTDSEADWTINYWVKKLENTNYNFLLISLDYSLRLDNGETESTVAGVTLHGIVDEMTDVTLPIDEWTMLTLVHSEDDVTINIYINGEYMTSIFNTMPLPLTLLGNDHDIKGWNTPLMAALDDVWLLPRVLSDDEVTTLYKTGTIAGITIPTTVEPDHEPTTVQDSSPTLTLVQSDVPMSAPGTSDLSFSIIFAGTAVSAVSMLIFRKKRNT